MSLIIYTKESQVPDGMKIIDYNDIFFDGILLQDDDLSELVLKNVDLVQSHTDKTFMGRDKELGYLNKSFLSTGCKTLLNIISSPDSCFDVCECGSNVIQFLSLLTKGNIFWKRPIANYMYSDICDIRIEGHHFTKSEDFIGYLGERSNLHHE